MDRSRKRSFRDKSPHGSKPERSKKPQSSSSPPRKLPSQQPSSPPPLRKLPTFISYTEIPNLPPKIKLLCEILANTPPLALEQTLNDTGVRVRTEDVEEILRLSYGFPGPAVKFFRWAGGQLNDNHSPYAWNLVVDLLGKNLLFEAMWDAIKSMKREGLLSLATFASVFSSYVVTDQVDEAIMTFEVMDQYGCPRDVVALNSLLSAICREGKTVKARDFFYIAKDKIRPDADTYAILLEGWENENDTVNANKTFGEMVDQFGWDPASVSAYDTFLTTLVKGRGDGIRDAMKFFDVMKDRRCYPGMKFLKSALEELVKDNNARVASSLWEQMVGVNGCKPDTQMYNSMIALQCYHNHVEAAYKYLDEMLIYGEFPDSHTYNVLFQFLIKGRKLKEASAIFNEMVKNECIPNQVNCTSAIRVYVDLDDPAMAIKIWKCIANEMSGLEEAGNLLVSGLNSMDRLPEARKYAEDMIERGIKFHSSTLSKLKNSLSKLGKGHIYDDLLRKWKSH